MSGDNRTEPLRRTNRNLSSRLLIAGALLILTLVVAAGYAAHIAPYLYSDDRALFTGLAKGEVGVSGLANPWLSVADWNYYRPLAALSLHLDYLIFGAHPAAFHWVGFSLFVLSAAATGLLASLLVRKRSAAIGAAAFVFALLHPLAVESVSWLTCRANLLSGLFSILACCCCTAYIRRGYRHLPPLAIASMLAAMLAKEDGLVSALLVVFLALFGRRPGRTAVLWMTAALAALTYLALRISLGHPLSLSAYLTTGTGDTSVVLTRLWHHLRSVFCPSLQSTSVFTLAVTAVLVAGIVGLGWRRPGRTAWVACCGMVAIGLIPASTIDAGLASGGRVLFVPMLLGARLLGISLFSAITHRRPRLILAALLSVLLASTTVDNLRNWQTSGRRALRIAEQLLALHRSAPPDEIFVFVDQAESPLHAPSVGGAVSHILQPPFTVTKREVIQGSVRLLHVLLPQCMTDERTYRAVSWDESHGLQSAPLPVSKTPEMITWRGGDLVSWQERRSREIRVLVSPRIEVSALFAEQLILRSSRPIPVDAEGLVRVETPHGTLSSPWVKQGREAVFSLSDLPYETQIERIDRVSIELRGGTSLVIDEIRWLSRIPELPLACRYGASANAERCTLTIEFGPVGKKRLARFNLHLFDGHRRLFSGAIERSQLTQLSDDRLEWTLRLRWKHLTKLGVRRGTPIFVQVEAVDDSEQGLLFARSKFVRIKLR